MSEAPAAGSERPRGAAGLEERPVRVEFWDRPVTEGVAGVRLVSPGRRLARALAALGLFWALAAVSVLIPLAHFLLVPGFFAAGVVAAVLRLRERETLESLRGACPRCGEPFAVEPGGRYTTRRIVECPACRNDLVVRSPAR